MRKSGRQFWTKNVKARARIKFSWVMRMSWIWRTMRRMKSWRRILMRTTRRGMKMRMERRVRTGGVIGSLLVMLVRVRMRMG